MTTFHTFRDITATVDEVFAAFSDPERLARWWGPAGFTNTFHIFEFETGGRWSYTMHSPHGGNPANESVFDLIEPPDKIVIQHISQPIYRLTIELKPSANGTMVSWSQEFEDDEVARRIEKIVVPANEQNLDKLSAEVSSRHSEYYHGTRADLKVGDMIETGYDSNYGQRSKARHVYFSATLEAATWGAELAAGDGPGRIYIVETTGPMEDDPNLTNNRFAGNPTRSYRTGHPLRVVGEVTDWKGHAPEQIVAMKNGIAGLDPVDD